MRTQLKTKKLTQPDLIYSSRLIQMITQLLMRDGKKKRAYRILLKSLENIKTQTQQDPLLVIEKAVRNTTPSVSIQTRRIGGAVYPIPVELNIEYAVPRAIRWILMAAKKRKRSGKENTLDQKLAQEFLDASKKIGQAFHKKEEIQKIADANPRRRGVKKKKK